ncbi:hypothetical protein HII13_002745 [Brettanomyces bruxellensis]|nr:hypothetical protein HII13_002745 [Brettanomyces bruxellensis]
MSNLNKMRRKSSRKECSNVKRRKTSSSQSSTITAADLSQMEYLATMLQKTVRTIIDKAPNMSLLKDHIAHLAEVADRENNNSQSNLNGENTLQPELVILMRSQKVQLIARLKTMLDDGKLPIFKQIAEFNDSTIFTDSESTTLNVTRRPSDQHIADNDKHNLFLPNKPTRGYQMLYKSFPGTGMPDLPLIHNRALEARVFTHKSIVNNVKHLSVEDALHSHNERLEFLGDAILEGAVTEVIYKKFPNSDEGEMSRMRSDLVNNLQLAEYATKYGFDKKLHKDTTTIGQFFRGKRKPVADVFEAYIGGLAVDGNYENVDEIRNWLAEVMREKLDLYKKNGEYDAKEKIDKNAKAQLYALIGSARSHPEYIVESQGEQGAKVNCVMSNEIIGTGKGAGVKDASLKAAMKALKNRKAIAKYSAIRLKTPRGESVIPLQQNKNEGKEGNEGQNETKYELPVEIKADAEPLKKNKQYKNELYKLLAMKKSLPEYKTERMDNNKMIKCTLLVNSVPVCYCCAANAKIGGNSCAKYVLEHKDILGQCYVF